MLAYLGGNGPSQVLLERTRTAAVFPKDTLVTHTQALEVLHVPCDTTLTLLGVYSKKSVVQGTQRCYCYNMLYYFELLEIIHTVKMEIS